MHDHLKKEKKMSWTYFDYYAVLLWDCKTKLIFITSCNWDIDNSAFKVPIQTEIVLLITSWRISETVTYNFRSI